MASLIIEHALTANTDNALIAEAEAIIADPDFALLMAEAEMIKDSADAYVPAVETVA